MNRAAGTAYDRGLVDERELDRIMDDVMLRSEEVTMPASLKTVVWWTLAILVFVWVFKTPGAAHSVTSLFSALMSAILAVANNILKALGGIIPGA